MLTFSHPDSSRFCDGITRRDWLHIGSLGAFGLTLPGLLAQPALPTRKAKSVILLFLLGAPPQQETWDPKPDSPLEYRGDMTTIATTSPGLRIGEMFPMTARQTRKIALLRAVQTRDNAHSSSGYTMTTGVPHAPRNVENVKPGAPNDWPSVGGIVRRTLRTSSGIPSAFTLPEQAANDGNITWPGQDAGFLGRSADPWLLNCDPSSAEFSLPGLDLPADVSPERFQQRQSLLKRMEARSEQLQRGLDRGAIQRHQLATEMISSPSARRAFNLSEEDPKLRDRYGRSRFGQSCLLARRLVESGVRLVRVNWTRVPNTPNNGHWDTHTKNTASTRALGPILDSAYATLLEDLTDRGMLDETLVIWMAEFGRTPKINGAAGRDHWGNVFTVALAGGGVRGGVIHGSSDRIAAYPKEGVVQPEDLMATIYHTLGIPLDTEIRDTLDRPLAITKGSIIRPILG
jgi:uncharacterized protein (DUF1501 family)